MVKNLNGMTFNLFDVDSTLNKFPLDFRYVSGDFDCRFNEITDLKGCPTKIGGSLYLYHNKLKSLEGYNII